MDIGPRLRRLRQDRGWTLQQLVEVVGTDTGNLSRIERGEYYPRMEMLENIAQAFDLTVAELFTYGDPVVTSAATQVPVIAWSDVAAWCAGKDTPSFRSVPVHGRVGARAFALEVQDTAMGDAFPQGSVIAADPGASAESGAFVLIETAGQVLFRQLHQAGKRQYLTASDPRHPTLEIGPDDRLLARVIRRLEQTL